MKAEVESLPVSSLRPPLLIASGTRNSAVIPGARDSVSVTEDLNAESLNVRKVRLARECVRSHGTSLDRRSRASPKPGVRSVPKEAKASPSYTFGFSAEICCYVLSYPAF